VNRHFSVVQCYQTAANNIFNCDKMKYISLTPDKVFHNHLSASSYIQVTNYQIWSDFCGLN